MTKHLLLAGIAALWCATSSAQVVTTEPAILQTDSKGIVITYHADEGNKALANLPATTKVYAHTGCITNQSTSDSDWKYGPKKWGDNDAKYEMKYVAPNTYTLDMGEINTYYGITDPSVVVKKLAFVFRDEKCTKEGKTASGGDIFLTVAQPGFEISFTSDPSTSIITAANKTVTFNINSTVAGDISLHRGSADSPAMSEAKGVKALTSSTDLEEEGEYKFVAVVKADGQVKTAELSFVRVGDVVFEAYPGGTPLMGARPQADGSVLFCIAAPKKNSAVVIGSWNTYNVGMDNVMKCQEYNGNRYFWTRIKGLADNTDYLYYYLIDGSIKVGDPYAHLVLDPSNDQWISPSVFPDMPAYPSEYVQNVPLAVFNKNLDDYKWEVSDFKAPSKDHLVVYELLLRDFTGTEGKANGDGTVNQAIAKLDYLKNLGVNAVELLPIMEFNGNLSWGYNTNFYMAPDKAYGTPDDYKRFIDECHKRGMAVILDIVFNQSDWLHPWYQMYSMNENPFYNGSAPHAYSVLNDWNQDNPIVQQQWYDALAYWMTAYKVDGFRFDLVKGLGNNDSYGATYNPNTNKWTNVTDYNTNKFNQSRVDRMKKIHDEMRKVNPDAYFINELLGDAQEENMMATDGEINWANINYNSCQFAMGFDSDASLARFYAPRDGRTWGSTVSYAESHDEERMAYKQGQWGAAGVKGNIPMSMRRLGSVGAQMLMSPGAHMIWQFQEFGADQTTKDANGGNNTGNKLVVWNYLDNPDRHGLMTSYSELANFRLDNPQLFDRNDNVSVSLAATGSMRTIRLSSDNSQAVLLVNPSVSQPFNAVVDNASGLKIYSQSYNCNATVNGNIVTVEPGAYVLLGTTNLVGVDSVATDSDLLHVYGVQGGIRVIGSDSVPAVYTLSGARCSSADGLAPGLYLVRVDGRSFKVMVR